MAITAAVATVAVAAGSTIYNISEQKKAAAKQEGLAKDQEAKQAALSNEAKLAENRQMSQAFATAAKKRGQSTTAAAPTSNAIGSSAAVATGGKSLIGT